MHILTLLLCVYVTCIVFSMDYTTPLFQEEQQAKGWLAIFWVVVIVGGIVFFSII